MQEINEPQDVTLVLSEEEQAIMAKRLGELFGKLDAERQAQLNDISLLRDAVYGHNSDVKNTWNADFRSTDIYEMAQTLKSHLMESLYTHPDAMFDVSGRTPEAQKFANEQKSALVTAFEHMELGVELEKVVDGLIEAGEAALFIGWRTVHKDIRRLKTEEELILTGDQELTTTEQRVEYDGASVRYVPCEDFVFDTEEKLSWDRRLKMYRTYITVDELLNGQNNNCLTAEKSALLREIAAEKRQKSRKSGNESSALEVIEIWGDLESPNGKSLKNWLFSIVERKVVVRSEQNPYITNPFVYATLVKDPQTKRGISPLKIALPLCAASSTILNKQLDALSLIINPPYLAPKGCFKGEQVVTPGKIIEYDSALMPSQPIPLRFDSALVGWEFIKYFKNAMETSTGIFRNMSGDYQPQSRTATEVSYSAGSQAVRLNGMIDSISRKLIIPMVEKTAQILAGFRFGEELVPVMQGGQIVFIEITDEIRQSQYFYRFGDRKAGLERKYRMKELYETIFQLAKMPGMAEKVDWEECFTFALEQFGIENSKQFFKSEAPPPQGDAAAAAIKAQQQPAIDPIAQALSAMQAMQRPSGTAGLQVGQ